MEKVKVKTPVISGHSIEWGDAEWTKGKTPKEKSIRSRYTNKAGRFNYAGSSEVPWSDFNGMILESIKRKQFSKEELAEILAEIIRNF